MITPEARKRLAELMEQRIVDLRLTWREVAEAGDISYEALRAARNGSGDIRRTTQAGIEDGLRWERGSVSRVLEGGSPVPRREVDFSGGIEEDLRPYVAAVLAEAYEVLRSMVKGDLAGPDDPDVQAAMFRLPGALIFDEREARIWDDPRLSRKQRLDILAFTRQLADRTSEREDRRTGLTGTYPALAPVAGTAYRESS